MANKNNDHNLSLSEKPFSLLQANDFFVNKILSRNSSFAGSGRLSACQRPGQIPFEWETLPGKPKEQISEQKIPAPEPESSPECEDLSRAYVGMEQPPATGTAVWKKPKKKHGMRKNGLFGSSRRHKDMEGGGEYVLSSCISYTSRSSSSSRDRRRNSKLGGLAKWLVRWAL